MLKSHIANTILAIIIIVGTLITNNFFGPKTLTAYFIYTVLGAFIATAASVAYLRGSKKLVIVHPIPIMFFLLLVGYYVIQNLIGGYQALNNRHWFLIINALLLVAYCILFNSKQIDFKLICTIISVIASLEAFVCVLQYVRIIGSLDTLYTITGTCINPNITAMFLVMALPAVWLTIFISNRGFKILAVGNLLLIIVAFVLLQCRTAFIGAIICTGIIINHQFKVLPLLRKKYNAVTLLIFSAVLCCLVVSVGFYLYHFKEASADGRAFIWKISSHLFYNNLVTGIGYGHFEHDYNLAQAQYFASGAATQQQIMNASFVRMAYNEFIEAAVEGGIIGCLLFTGFFASLVLWPFLRSSKNYFANSLAIYAYAAVVSFAIMSCLNFTIQAIPAMALFVFYASYCVSNNAILPTVAIGKQQQLKHKNRYTYALSKPLVGLLALVGGYSFLSMLLLGKCYSNNQNLQIIAYDGNAKSAVTGLKVLEINLTQSGFYWQGYGSILYANGKYKMALDKFDKAKAITSDPDLYLLIGNCYYKTGQYVQATTAYITAQNIQPHRFAPRYALLKLYGATKDTTKILYTAKAILELHPKIQSPKIQFYKKEAEVAITKINPKTY